MIKKLYRKIRKSWFSEIKTEIRSLVPPITLMTVNYTEIELTERLKDSLRLERYGYKVYSQNDEDGIIAEIFKQFSNVFLQLCKKGG
jgi:hypothetical protein